MINNIQYNWSLVSKYRGELMGLGILGVMLGHFLEWNSYQGVVSYIFKPFVGLVFTEGFLLLSGLGLYYSFKKNDNLKVFYKKRVNRLLIPFFIMALPFYVLQGILYHETLCDFLLNITSLHFWFKGNDGMWYISVSILLYLLFPLIFKVTFKHNCSRFFRWSVILFLFYAIAVIIYYLFPDYYLLTGIGLSQMPMFIVGIMIGFLSFNNTILQRPFLFFILLGLLSLLTNIQDGVIGDFGNGVLRCFCILLLCPIFSWLEHHFKMVFKWMKQIFQWFGNYTLELYILHIFINKFLRIYMGVYWGGILSIAMSIIIAPYIHYIISEVISKFSGSKISS